MQKNSLLKLPQNLSKEERVSLSIQIEKIDNELLEIQQRLLKQTSSLTRHDPFTDYKNSSSIDSSAGKSLITDGKVGCIVLAGGQGTRLGHSGPKGTFPISIIKHKSLFQMICEKVVAASYLAKTPLPLAIMTSPENDEETRDFFLKNNFFGLSQNQLSFFCQKTLPLLDQDGNLFLKDRQTLARGPDGNGDVLRRFVEEGLAKRWEDQGITLVNTILVDNPLADPFPEKLFAHHLHTNADISLVCMEREDPEEQVGVVVQNAGLPRVIEYTEMPRDEFQNIDPNTKKFKHSLANLSLFCFSMNFIQTVAAKASLPLHRAFKATPYLNSRLEPVSPSKPNAWKFERYIFDLLPLAKKISPLVYPRKECFAPLKNADGIKLVQKALQEKDKIALEAITGNKAPIDPFELSPEFYYPTDTLKSKWNGKQCTNSGYICI